MVVGLCPVGSGADHEPAERLIVSGQSFEDQLTSLVEDTFLSNGFIVERFTRVPYMWEGDAQNAYYILYDAVFLLKTLS